MALPLIPFAIKAGAAGMSMIYSTATGQYVISAATAAWMAAKGVALGAAIAAAAAAIAGPIMTYFFPPWYAPLLTPLGLTSIALVIILVGGSYGYRQYKNGKKVNFKGALKDAFGWLKFKVLRIN